MCNLREALLLALVLLPRCSASEDTRQRVIGNGAYVSISNVRSEADATPLAERHCWQYGELAHLRQLVGDRAIFECVSP